MGGRFFFSFRVPPLILLSWHAPTRKVAGVRGDDNGLMEEVSWWARPEEAFTLDEKLLACGAAVVSRMRAAVRSELRYSCTAGEVVPR